jgi:hypothetical protein
MAIKRFYKIISPKSPNVDINTNQDIGGGGSFGNYTWYNRIVQGSANRLQRYKEYDAMDSDVDVARALDIIAEEMTGNNPKTELPLQIHMTAENEQRVKSATLVTLQASLKTWCKLQNWDTRMFDMVRNLVKYGDVFFFRPKKKLKRWVYVNPKNVINAIVAHDDVTEIRGWHIKDDDKKAQNNGNPGNMYFSVTGTGYDANMKAFNADEVIRYTLNNDLSEEAPFGESVLRAAFKIFKQKELLEDSIIIYRIVRAPERRVFYVDVGKMPPNKIATHLDMMKNEIRQKKIPTMQGGQNTIESVYNPTSTSEDYFMAVSQDRPNTRVETLAGGQNLGSLEDIQYFYQKMWRALRIPASYIINTNEDGSAFNDGAVGLAYIQEIKFAEYIERLQRHVEQVMDTEFKKFLHDMNLNIDPTIYQIQLPAPTNWSKSKQNKIDSELVNVYNNVKDDPTVSKRLAQEVFLQWDRARIAINERMLREEKGLDPDGGIQDLPKLYFPQEAEAGGFEGGLGSVGGADGGENGGDFSGGDADGGDGAEGGGDASAGAEGTPPPTDGGGQGS